jgi:hypothetical protein
VAEPLLKHRPTHLLHQWQEVKIFLLAYAKPSIKINKI